jgi:cysteine-rich repeat protein
MTLLSPRTALSQTGFSSLAFCVALALLAGCATSSPSTGIDEEDEGRPRFDTGSDEEDTEEEEPEEDVQGGDDADAGETADTEETPDTGEPSDVVAPDTTPDDTGAADTGTGDVAEDTGTAGDTGTTGDTGGTDTGSSACPTIPVCTLASTRCDGALLETCSRNAAGCAEWTSRNCGDTIPGGLCDDTLLPAICVEPPDLCEGLPNLCSTAGTQCDGTEIVTCAANADGCLVTTPTRDCADTAQTCAGTPPACVTPTCGDGAINRAGETCDDDNTTAGDGCSATCTVEDSYTCVGEPSVCTTEPCGNGRIDAGEDCDDRNDVEGDGCSRECLSEPVYTNCNGGITRYLSCDTGTFTGNTSTGSSRYTGYSCNATSYNGSEHIMVFRTDEPAFVTMSMVGTAGTGNVDLIVLQPGSTPGCTTSMSCASLSSEAGTDEFLTFVAEPGQPYIVLADGRATGASAAYNFEVDCSIPFCGDGSTVAPLCEQPIEMESGGIYVVESTISGTETTYRRPSTCTLASSVSAAYDAYTFTNPTAAAIDVTASASWVFDGYLTAYTTFNPANPTANCLAVNDDLDFDLGASQVTFSVPAGGSATIVASPLGSFSTGDYRLVVFADL